MESEHGHASAGATASPAIDAGMRQWYASCRCCLSDAYPEVVSRLDAEREAAKQPLADAGICEVAEADDAGVPSAVVEVSIMAKILDPVCDMIVDTEEQRGKGLVSEHEAKTYAFCGPGCKRAFDKDPTRFTAKVAAWEESAAHAGHGHEGHDHH